jgi:hypothetical protein
MLVITGDVHHRIGSGHQMSGFPDEHLYSETYLKILKKHKLKSTLFVTGKELEAHPGFWKRIHKKYPVEIGGHTYAAWDYHIFGQGFLFKKLFGTPYGPMFIQKNDIHRCLKAFKSLGFKLDSWRTHEYAGNHVTHRILLEAGIRVISDTVALGRTINPAQGPLSLPINTLPDHDYLSHGTQKGLSSAEYRQRLVEQLESLEKKKSHQVLLLHPVCMATDGFSLLRDLCQTFAGYKTAYCSELVQ